MWWFHTLKGLRMWHNLCNFQNFDVSSLQLSCCKCQMLYAEMFVTAYILAKSSNGPLIFYQFSSKPKAMLLFCLHTQTGGYVTRLKSSKSSTKSRHYIQESSKSSTKSHHYIQDVPMNTDTPTFKIHKILHFVTVCLFEMSDFH